jgi:hypothetical protein
MNKTLSQPISKSGISKIVTDLGIRAGIAKRMVGGVARAVGDPDRMRELWHRLQDYERYDSFRSATAAPRKTPAARVDEDIPFPLLVTSNSGLYLLEQGGWHCLLPVMCFGVARHGNAIFVGASAGLYSFVLAAEIVGAESITALQNIRVLARYETRYRTERIHQIAYDPRGFIQCVNSRRNSLLAISTNGGVADEKFLPYFAAQNDINAVGVNGDTLLFTCRYAGTGGALGFVANDIVRAYQYPVSGTHDVVIHEDGVMFTDSFREGSVAQNPNVSGAIRFRGEEYLSQAIEPGVRRLILRGLAIRENIIVVGISAYSPTREGRMKMDGGGVIWFRDEKLVGIIDGPFSQAHDILPVNGARTDAAGPPRSVAELDAMFRRDVGPLLFEGPLFRSDKVLPLL